MLSANSRKKCHASFSEIASDCSLVDYRNNYFTSDDPNKVIEFFNGFKNREHLIRWMKERPKGVATIHEVEGDKDIIVVIPTSDFNGKFATECKENIFKGLHMIFVQSAEAPDLYFNYAHNCNIGIRKSMEYGPKWVVVSNDDMKKGDDVEKMKEELSKISPEDYDIVWTPDSFQHSHLIALRKSNSIQRIMMSVFFRIPRLMPDSIAANIMRIRKKYGIDIAPDYDKARMKVKLSRILSKKVVEFKITGSFGIFSRDLIRKKSYKLFNEDYINGFEDTQLSLDVFLNNANCANINYVIFDIGGASLGFNYTRVMREYINLILFNKLYYNGQWPSKILQIERA